jgi:S-formylglutathione hydrolase FrmB
MYDISLLNQNMVVFFSLIAACACTFISTRLRKKWFGYRGFDIIAASVIASVVIEGLVHLEYPTDQLPTLLWLMVLPFTFSAGLIIAAWKNKRPWLKWLSVGTCLFCFLFSLILVNGYYSFYPTVGSVFNVGTAESDPTTVYHSSTKSAQSTIQSSLYAKNRSLTGQIRKLSIPGVVSKFKARSAYVYLPPVATGPVSVRLPVIVLTAGYPGAPENWVDSGIKTTMDHFAKLHNGVTPLVFMVDNTASLTNDTECVNSPRGNVETYLTDDVPTYIKDHYDVSSSSKQWAIGGLSMGGMCSFMLALRHPTVYDNFIDLGGETGPEVGSAQTTIDQLFYGSESSWAAHQPLFLLEDNRYDGMSGIFADGNGDSPSLLSGLRQAYTASEMSGIDSVFEEIPGGHTFAVWQQTFKDNLPWLSNRLGATSCSVACKQ